MKTLLGKTHKPLTPGVTLGMCTTMGGISRMKLRHPGTKRDNIRSKELSCWIKLPGTLSDSYSKLMEKRERLTVLSMIGISNRSK